MSSGAVDAEIFNRTIQSLVARARDNASDRKVRVFGQMVSILYRDNPAAAAELENLWDAAVETYSISVLCTYSLSGNDAGGELSDSLLAPHFHRI